MSKSKSLRIFATRLQQSLQRLTTALTQWSTQDPNYHWWAGAVKCDICSYVHVAVIEIPKILDEPIHALQCANCGNFSSYPMEEL